MVLKDLKGGKIRRSETRTVKKGHLEGSWGIYEV